MKRWSVIVELPAQQDIAEAHRWLAERDPEAADRWLIEFTIQLARWKRFPNAVRWRQRASFSIAKSVKHFMAAGNISIGFF